MSTDFTSNLRAKAKELLSAKAVECVIGYETGSDGVNARPAFVYEANDTDRLVFDRTCTHNLTKYLLSRKGKKTAIVVKGCDSRSLHVLLTEKQIKKEDIFVIGVVCPGVFETGWNSKSQKLQARCEVCRVHTPILTDFLIGEPVNEEPPTDYPDVAEWEKKTPAEREAFWQAQAEKCLRCYACRQACPGCYCTDCFAERLDPEWVGIRIGGHENHMWNMIRAYHLAGRCAGCNECERACPVHIPLRLLNRKVEKETVKLFGHRVAGKDTEVEPLLAYKKDEKLGIDE